MENTKMTIIAEITLFQLPGCGYCRKVREKLDEKKVRYATVNVSPSRTDILRQKLLEKSGGPTVPVLKIGEKYIGESEAILKYLGENF